MVEILERATEIFFLFCYERSIPKPVHSSHKAAYDSIPAQAFGEIRILSLRLQFQSSDPLAFQSGFQALPRTCATA
jgi:hypothetical protein